MGFFLNKFNFKKLKIGVSLSAIMTILCFFLVAIILIWTFIPLIVTQAQKLAEVDYGQIFGALEEPISRLNKSLTRIGLTDGGSDPGDAFQESLSKWFKPSQIGDFFSSMIGIAGSLVFAVFSIVFITFFFLKDTGLFVNFLIALVPTQYEERVRQSVESISRLLTRYFGGILIQITIITIIVSSLLSLFGIQNALLIGFFAALINVIPYLGPLIGAVFGVILTISANLDIDFYTQMLPLLLKVVAVFAIMQLIDNFVLQPFIFSNSVSAHPLEIFIVILMGAQLGGITGMILAIPFYTVIRVIGKVFLSEFRIVQKITAGMKNV
jgi:predicted PurR-regulated permease PerM